MVTRILELNLEGVTDKKELQLSSHEKAILKSFVAIFEPFEIATNLLQGEKYSSVSMALPSYYGIIQNVKKVQDTSRYNQQIITTLLQSLEKRLGHMERNSFYCIAATLDPSFKLKWYTGSGEKVLIEEMVLREMRKNLDSDNAHHMPTVETSGKEVESAEPPSKKRKLFTFMDTDTSNTEDSLEGSIVEKEFKMYLDDTDFTQDENPLKFWKIKAKKYPILSTIAKNKLGVPATSAPIERVFSHSGNILRPNRCRLLPKNFEQLIYLKMNAGEL